MSGRVTDLPAKWSRILAGYVPAAAISEILTMAQIHMAEADAPTSSPGIVQDEIEDLEERVGRWREHLRSLPSAVSDELTVAALRMGHPGLMRECEDRLKLLDHAIGIAWQSLDPKPGARPRKRSGLVREVASILAGHGVELDSRSGGSLYLALDVLFELIDQGRQKQERPADLSGLIARELERMRQRKNPLEKG